MTPYNNGYCESSSEVAVATPKSVAEEKETWANPKFLVFALVCVGFGRFEACVT